MLRKLVLSACRLVFRLVRYRGLSQYTPLIKLFHSLFRLALPQGEISVSVNNGIRLYLDRAENTDMVRHLVLGRSYEPGTTRIFGKLVRRGMTVIDIGSHVGYYTTLAASLVGAEGKVFAFEPDPAVYRLLCKNIEVNRLRNVVPVQKAVARKISTRKMYLKPEGRTSRLYHSEDTGTIEVEAVCLDQHLGTSSKVDFIKMDIEGAEYEALLGMESTIKYNENLILVTEFCPFLLERAGFSATGYLGRLSDLGFALYMINERTPKEGDGMLGPVHFSVKGERTFNILCVKNNAVLKALIL